MPIPLRSRASRPTPSPDSGTRPVQTYGRREERTLLLLEVWFQYGGTEGLRGTSRDVSLSGLFIQTLTPAPFGAAVTLWLQAPDRSENLRIEATVRWVNSEGMGVQFGSMGARETHALLTLIAEAR